MADAKGAYVGGVPVQFKDAAARAMISDEYNSAETYAKGNLCIYNGKIYEAIKETTGTWDATAWEETTLAEVNAKMRSDITNLTDIMLNMFSNEKTVINIPAGNYFVMAYATGVTGISPASGIFLLNHSYDYKTVSIRQLSTGSLTATAEIDERTISITFSTFYIRALFFKVTG